MSNANQQSATAPGWNANAPTSAALADIDRAIKGIEKDEYSGDVKPPLGNALTCLQKIPTAQWEAADDAREQLNASRAVLDGAADAAAAALPTSGWASPQDLQGARASAREGVFRSALQSATNVVLSKRAKPMQDLANAAQFALRAAEKEIDWAAAQWSGPSALGENVTIEDLHRIGSVEKQIKAQRTPMLYVLDYLQQAVANADAKTLSIFTEAARTVALDFRDTPPAKLQARYTYEQTASLDNERARAFQVLRALDRVRGERQPPSLAAAVRILGALAAVFDTVCGYAARDLSGAAFAARYLNGDGSGAGKAEARFAIDSDFPARFLPPNADGPPGWSPLVWTDTGKRVRAGTLRGQ